MSGAGVAPAGTTLAGLGIPVAASGAPKSAPLDSVFIDPATKDYQYDSNGERVQTTRARHMVYLAMATMKGSANDPTLGLDSPPRVILPNYTQKRASMYADAFAPLEKAGIAKLLSVDVRDNGTTGKFEVVRWMDLSSLEQVVTTI